MEEERVSTGKLFGVRPTDECRTWTGGDHLYRMETGVLTIGLHWAASSGTERDSTPSVRPGRTARGQARESADEDCPGESAGEPAEGRP